MLIATSVDAVSKPPSLALWPSPLEAPCLPMSLPVEHCKAIAALPKKSQRWKQLWGRSKHSVSPSVFLFQRMLTSVKYSETNSYVQ